MDPFDDLLRGVRADGGGFNRVELSPPWTLRLGAEESLTLCAPLRGEGWISTDGRERVVRPGDTVIARGPFALADRPVPADTPPADGAVVLVATYRVRGEVSRRLLDVLPPVLVAPGGDGCSTLVDVVDAQATACAPGRQVALDRLLDWLVVCTLRAWFDGPGAASPGWFRALGDEVVGPVLRAMHAAPEKPWTLAALAAEAGVSRTTLAGRFTALVGVPPLTYLTEWRLTSAADLLAGSTTTVAAVARRVGYADAFGFSTAFKRFHGVSPREYRLAPR